MYIHTCAYIYIYNKCVYVLYTVLMVGGRGGLVFDGYSMLTGRVVKQLCGGVVVTIL